MSYDDIPAHEFCDSDEYLDYVHQRQGFSNQQLRHRYFSDEEDGRDEYTSSGSTGSMFPNGYPPPPEDFEDIEEVQTQNPPDNEAQLQTRKEQLNSYFDTVFNPMGKNTMYTYKDYTKAVANITPKHQEVSAKVLTNCEGALDGYSSALLANFVENSNLANSLPYGKVEAIKNTLTEAIIFGLHVYVAVAMLNNVKIKIQPGQDLGELYAKVHSDDGSLMHRYDVLPLLTNGGETFFDSFLDAHQEFMQYPFRETNIIRIFISLGLKTTYLMALISSETTF